MSSHQLAFAKKTPLPVFAEASRFAILGQEALHSQLFELSELSQIELASAGLSMALQITPHQLVIASALHQPIGGVFGRLDVSCPAICQTKHTDLAQGGLVATIL